MGVLFTSVLSPLSAEPAHANKSPLIRPVSEIQRISYQSLYICTSKYLQVGIDSGWGGNCCDISMLQGEASQGVLNGARWANLWPMFT